MTNTNVSQFILQTTCCVPFGNITPFPLIEESDEDWPFPLIEESDEDWRRKWIFKILLSSCNIDVIFVKIGFVSISKSPWILYLSSLPPPLPPPPCALTQYTPLLCDLGFKKLYLASARSVINNIPIWHLQRPCDKSRIAEIVRVKKNNSRQIPALRLLVTSPCGIHPRKACLREVLLVQRYRGADRPSGGHRCCF